MRIFDNIEKNAIKHEDKICMVHGDRFITYGEIVENMYTIAKLLSSQLNIGDKVIIQYSDPIQQVINLLACAKAGLVSILMDNNMNHEIMENIKKKINPNCVINDLFILPTNQCNLPIVSKEDIFFGALSSGTTAEHKIIWRDHQSWTSAFKAQSEIFLIDANDTLFLSGSLVYTANLNSALHILNEGGKIIFSETYYPRTWIKEIIQNKVTSIFMVPSHYRILVKNMKESLHKIHSMVSAGEKLDKETALKLKNLFPNAKICEYYGASELGHVSYIGADEILKNDSVGKSFPGVKLWIEDKVIWVESPYLAPNFRPKATVGDLGKLDEQGNLYILGRKNDIINKGGIKIFPWEVEEILHQHPQIIQAAVLGIKHPIKGEQVVAIIVTKDSELTYKKILAFCKNHLQPQAYPQKIKFVEKIPMDDNIKASRKSLAKWFIE